MKSKNLLIILLVVAFVIGVILIATLFIPVVKRPQAPVPQVQITPIPVSNLPQNVQEVKPYAFQKASELYDPFSSKNLQLSKLQEEMDLKNLEIELLKLELERLKLQSQIDSIRKERGMVQVSGSEGLYRVLAISSASGASKALIDNGYARVWVREGDVTPEFQVLQISKDLVVLRTATGKIVRIKPGE